MAGFSLRTATALAMVSPAMSSNATLSAPDGQSAAFVHLFEWSWSDVAKECEEFLGPKGFTAVQVSPPNEHITGDAWWTRYQPVTYKLVSRSGDRAAFKDMVERCKRVGVGIYADAVINHIAAGGGTGVAGSSYGNRATPIYTADDMHHNNGDNSKNCGVSNYQDKHNVQYCDLSGLPDLCTSCDKVKKTVAAYLNDMANIGIAGFRIDAAKHQDVGELGALLSAVDSKLWRFQEVISGAGEAVTVDMYYKTGEVTEFDYSRKLAPNFQSDGKLQYLESFGTGWGLMPRGDAVVFMDNHDTQRGEAKLTYKNGKIYELANIFMLAHPYGYPKVMSSYYFDSHDQGPPKSSVHHGSSVACGAQPNGVSAPAGGSWVCEHRWTPIANMVGWRRAAGSNGVSDFQKFGADTIAFCRGKAACVAINRQSSSASITVKMSVAPGSYCDIIQSDDASSCPKVVVGTDGKAKLNVPPLSAVAIHVGKKVEDTVIV